MDEIFQKLWPENIKIIYYFFILILMLMPMMKPVSTDL